MSQTLSASVQCVSHAQSLLQHVCQALLETEKAHFPDLSHIAIIVPDADCAADFRRLFMQTLHDAGLNAAFLGADCLTLNDWLNRQFPPTSPVLSAYRAEIMLVEALEQYPGLMGNITSWDLAQALSDLFSRLGDAQALLNASQAEFLATLQAAYGLEDSIQPFSQQAVLVHTLWQAWQTQIEAEGVLDAHEQKRQAMQRACAASSTQQLVFVGFDAFTPLEWDFFQRLAEQQRARLFLQLDEWTQHPLQTPFSSQITSHATTSKAQFFQAALQTHVGGLKGQRKKFTHSPFLDPQNPRQPAQLAIFAAEDLEREARGIVIQIRQWLAEKKHRIALVTDDRRLARRVRALLERANIRLRDGGGWALSTTSVATVLDRWLQCLAEDFAWQPLLDVVKSPFIRLLAEPEQQQRFIYRLERDVIEREGIAQHLSRYAKAARFRQQRLGDWLEEETAHFEQAIEILAAAAKPAQALKQALEAPAVQWFKALDHALQSLGLAESLAQDPAGVRLLQELQRMQQALEGRDIPISLSAFRSWINRTLENHHFAINDVPSAVELLGFRQARCREFDGLILAGASAKQLPGSHSPSAFFNDQVLAELGISTWKQQRQERFQAFRHCLNCAPEVLLSYPKSHAGDPISPSPWVEALESFHQLCFGQSLRHPYLNAWAAENPTTHPLTTLPDEARLPTKLIPEKLSAASHQRLIECPYRFFAADGLKLRARESVQQALQKNEFGELVHHCLEAFHRDLPGFPKAFAHTIDADNRQQAIQHLHTISAAVFAKALKEDFLTQGLYKQWLHVIPQYIDWQTQQAQSAHISQVEIQAQQALAENFALFGRLDRIDAQRDANAEKTIIDYKTGSIPQKTDVLAGEAVQLATYALLHPAQKVLYLSLKHGQRKLKNVALEQQELDDLLPQIQARLQVLYQQLHAQQPLPANGIETLCHYCEYAGLCRVENN